MPRKLVQTVLEHSRLKYRRMDTVHLDSQTDPSTLFTQYTRLGQTKFLPEKEIPGDTFGTSHNDKGVQGRNCGHLKE